MPDTQQTNSRSTNAGQPQTGKSPAGQSNGQANGKNGQANGKQAPAQASQQTHYDLLGIKPGASPQQVRRAYRDLSKLYHPDTTELSDAIATAKFQALNEAYATLSNPEQRTLYDHKLGYSRFHVMQAPADIDQPSGSSQPFQSRHIYLDPTDRPLSAGEMFALFILGVTFAACLALVVIVGFTKGEINITAFPPGPTAAVDLAPAASEPTNLKVSSPETEPNHTNSTAPSAPTALFQGLNHDAADTQYPTL